MRRGRRRDPRRLLRYYDERVIDGISGHYLPMASRLTPVSTLLICDDPRLIDAAEQLLDGPVGELTAGNGALRLVSGSHHPEQKRPAGRLSRPHILVRTDAEAAQASIPGYAADTTPGDVITCDLHAWHASTGGRDRLAWTAAYQRCPETGAECHRTLRSMHGSFEQAFRRFDRTRYPLWRDWLADADAHPRRASVIERMRNAGALDLPGARDGW